MSDRPTFHYSPREDGVPTPEALLGRTSLRSRTAPKSKAEVRSTENRRSSVSNSFRNTSVPTPPKIGGPMSVAASGAGPSLPAPPKPGRSSTMPLSSQDSGAGSSVGGSGYGTRPKGRPTYVPQRARPDGGDGPPPPPPPTSLPSWAIISGSEKADVPQDHQQMSGIPTSGPSKNTGETVPPHTSGAQTSDQHRNTVGTVRPHTSGASTSDQRRNTSGTVRPLRLQTSAGTPVAQSVSIEVIGCCGGFLHR